MKTAEVKTARVPPGTEVQAAAEFVFGGELPKGRWRAIINDTKRPPADRQMVVGDTLIITRGLSEIILAIVECCEDAVRTLRSQKRRRKHES